MIDEIYDRHYLASRAEVNRVAALGLGRLASLVRESFEVLVGIEYSAPWTTKPKGTCCN